MKKRLMILVGSFALLMLVATPSVFAKSGNGNKQITEKFDASGSYTANSSHVWAGTNAGDSWDFDIHIKLADDPFDSTGVVTFVNSSESIEITGHVEVADYNYNYWADDNLVAMGKTKFDGLDYNFMFLFRDSKIWLALGDSDYNSEWQLGGVWGGSLRDYQTHSTVYPGQFDFESFTKDIKENKSNGTSEDKCTTIQSGELKASDGSEITPGYDSWGYNYQARLFNGMYCDSYRDAAWCQPYKDVALSMKWNDAWLSNKDCDGDGLLDRHYGHNSYIGSGAWLTNHQSGEYYDDDESLCKWNYFTKIAAVPDDAELENVDGVDIWFTVEGDEIGPKIWGAFATIQTVSNDSCAGEHGVQYLSPAGPGFGKWK